MEFSTAPRIWIFGGTSIIGWSLAKALPAARPFCNPYVKLPVCRQWSRLVWEDERALSALFAEEEPDLLLYCGGVCNVAKCEADPEWAYRVNVTSLEGLLRQLPDRTRLVYVSSDHVFGHRDGLCSEETEPTPISFYGGTRVAAERLVQSRPNSLVVRPGLAIGPSIDGRSGHLNWLQYRHRRRLPITIIADEVRSAMWTVDLARRIGELAASDICGLRHVAGEHCVSRPELAKTICTELRIEPSLKYESRHAQSYPHIGRIELVSRYRDALAAPLSGIGCFGISLASVQG